MEQPPLERAADHDKIRSTIWQALAKSIPLKDQTLTVHHLLDRPNPKMTWWDLTQSVREDWRCDQRSAFLWIVKKEGIPIELWPLPCKDVIYRTSAVNPKKHVFFVIEGLGKFVELDVDEVLIVQEV